MYSNRCMEHGIPMNETQMPKEMDMNMGSCCGMPAENLPGITCQPIHECPQERCIHRQIVHEVPHVVPVNTKVINHHIYRHTYSPCFTCCEENVCSNVFEGPRCGC